MNKLYVTDMNTNGTSDLIIVDDSHEVLYVYPEAIFGNIPALNDGWFGDSEGNIIACDGQDVIRIEHDDTSLDAILEAQCLYMTQVIEVSLNDVLKRIAVSPVNDGSSLVQLLETCFGKVG